MSGIVGLVQRDGTGVDRRLLERLTEFLRFRGPDAAEVWADGPAGLGHTLLRATRETGSEHQPCSLDGEVWLAADARLDGRAHLIEQLKAAGSECSRSTSDAELILQAYSTWSEECVQHLLGDFCFAIWDGRSRRLFCARDHFGVKPFFYAQRNGFLLFSNTLDCLRQHPGVSTQLDEQAIGDFLLFDNVADPEATAFAGIRRLAPGHILNCAEGAVRIRRYWKLPVNDALRYKHAADYVERFQELLDTAVADRLRNDRAGVLMSGGLDSTTVAASAQSMLSKRGGRFELLAHTTVYDRLIPHEERHYAGLVAGALGIPIQFFEADDYRLYDGWNEPELSWPEPTHDPLAAIDADQFREISCHSRVALTGLGGDPALACYLSSHLLKLFKGLHWGQLAADLARYMLSEGRMARLYLRTRLRRWTVRENWSPYFPAWLEEGFARRLNLRERWEQWHREPSVAHPVRPEAHSQLIAPVWPLLLESFDPGITRAPLEVRHPFFDLRLLDYLLRLPALPWCSDKELLRLATRGILPEQVRLRQKTPLHRDPIIACLARPEAQWVDRFEATPELSRYVVRSRIPPVAKEKDSWRAWIGLRPLSLNFWLQSVAGADRGLGSRRLTERDPGAGRSAHPGRAARAQTA